MILKIIDLWKDGSVYYFIMSNLFIVVCLVYVFMIYI